jgi:hypothetical protein
MLGPIHQRISDLEGFEPLDLSMVAWALATMNTDPGGKLTHWVKIRAQELMPRLAGNTLISTVWSIAKLGLEVDGRLFDSICARASVDASKVSGQVSGSSACP